MTARDKGPNNAAWTKKHEAEAQHQKKERLKRACAATEEGTAKGSAVSAKELEDFRKAERKAASELVKKRRRHLAILAEPKRMDIDGKRVFVDGSALEELDKPVGAWAALRVERRLHSVVERQQASIIVVSNPAEPGDRNGVVASMLGLRLCTPCFLASGKGTALQLQTALQVPRYIFISAACQAKHTAILNLMQSVSRGAKKSRWLFFGPSTKTVFFFAGSATRQKAQGGDGDAGVAHRAGDMCKVPRIADGPGIHAGCSEADMGKLTHGVLQAVSAGMARVGSGMRVNESST